MLIVFEGPDKVGKSTWAKRIGIDGSWYNLKKGQYRNTRHEGRVVTVDRVAWLTHSVYRLALPEYEWGDRAVRTVFAMPDAHLVFLLPNDQYLDVHDELYSSQQSARIRDAYREWCWMLCRLNSLQNGSLFRTISLVEAYAGGTSGRVYKHVAINSLVFGADNNYFAFGLGTVAPESLVSMLREFE